MTRTWIGVYVAIVVAMVVIHLMMRKHHTALVRSLIADMDNLIAQYTTTLWTHRDQIYQYEDNVGLLFRTMNRMLDDSSASYHTYRDSWFEDVSYASSLLSEELDLPDLDYIRNTDESLGDIQRLYGVLGSLIAVMTLGLYLLWRQPLHTA